MPTNNMTYTNPSILNLVSKIVKHQNTILIEEYGKKQNYDSSKIERMKQQYIKLNHIYPNVTLKKNREYLQCLLIKKNK